MFNIVKMFYQVIVRAEHRNLLCFLWWEESLPFKRFRDVTSLTTSAILSQLRYLASQTLANIGLDRVPT